MIIARSPLRITLGGGGTDLPSFYEKYGGFCIAAAINKYVYVAVHRPFEPGIFLKYSQMEHVQRVEEIQHPIIREALRLLDIEPPLEITSLADIPAGTGLGSSGAFTTALLKALYAHKHETVTPDKLAEQACQIEIDILKRAVGKQDQYIAAFGGMQRLAFSTHASQGEVDVRPLKLKPDVRHDLEDNLLLFFTGFTHDASGILEDQQWRTEHAQAPMIENLIAGVVRAHRTQEALEAGNIPQFAANLNDQWTLKHVRSPGMTNPKIDSWHEAGLARGALGGKLVGAGGGGFLLFYAHNRTQLRAAMCEAGLQETRFAFEDEGTTLCSL